MNESAKQTIETISELIAGGELFDSHGFSLVKVTKNGEAKTLRLPIKSTGVAEYQEKLNAKAPRPPVQRIFFPKGSAEARELNVNGPVSVVEFDNTDEKYIDALEKHDRDFTWKVAVYALDLKWKRKEGGEAASFAEKVEILKSNGLTGHQIQQIFKDVQALTRLDEDRKDFLSES